VIQLKTEFVSGLVMPAVVAVELGFHGQTFQFISLTGFCQTIKSSVGPVNLVIQFYAKLGYLGMHVSKKFVKIMVQLGPLVLVIHMFL